MQRWIIEYKNVYFGLRDTLDRNREYDRVQNGENHAQKIRTTQKKRLIWFWWKPYVWFPFYEKNEFYIEETLIKFNELYWYPWSHVCRTYFSQLGMIISSFLCYYSMSTIENNLINESALYTEWIFQFSTALFVSPFSMRRYNQ